VPKNSDLGAVHHLWQSPWAGWVGVRYLKSKKNSRFLSFITVLSVAGVGLGVTAMIVVLSVMDGFEAQLKKRLMSSDLHVLVSPTNRVANFEAGFVPQGALDLEKILKNIPNPSAVDAYWPILRTEAILKSGRKVTGVVMKGITDDRMARLKPYLTETAESQFLVQKDGSQITRQPGIFIGQELAVEMGAIPGDIVSLISPTETEGPLQNVPRMRRYVIEGIYHSGLPEEELHTIFAPVATVRSFLRRADVLTHWEISVKDFDQAPGVARAIEKVAPEFRVQDWNQLNAHLFASLRLERIAMFVVLAFTVIVASFNIVTTLTLMVLEKKKEISILKAMGARHGQVAAIFLAEGLLIGVVGILGGTLSGLGLCAILRRYEFITLPEIYYDRTLPVTFNPLYYLVVAVVAHIIVLMACHFPSRRAARLNPLDGIRFG